MHRIVKSIASLAQHLVLVPTDPERYRPPACPHCGLGGVWRHGCYHRKADRRGAGTLNPVAVLRFFCRGCVRTCSRLPECLSPRRWFDWAVQEAVLLLLLQGMSLRGTALAAGRSRRTVRRWRDWLQERDAEFAFFLRSRWPELGRVAEFDAFWRHVIAELSLASAMAWLDRHLVVP